MARTIYEDIQAENDAVQGLSNESDQVLQQAETIIQRLGKLVVPRGDTETVQAIAQEAFAVFRIALGQKESREELDHTLRKAQSLADINPVQFSATLIEILEMFKHLRSQYESGLKELREIKSRLDNLLDESTPKA